MKKIITIAVINQKSTDVSYFRVNPFEKHIYLWTIDKFTDGCKLMSKIDVLVFNGENISNIEDFSHTLTHSEFFDYLGIPAEELESMKGNDILTKLEDIPIYKGEEKCSSTNKIYREQDMILLPDNTIKIFGFENEYKAHTDGNSVIFDYNGKNEWTTRLSKFFDIKNVDDQDFLDNLDTNEYLDKVQRIRARQISTYMNAERDKKYKAGEYLTNSEFYNSLVSATEDKLHISPDQLEELYILYDMLKQVEIELNEELDISLTSSDYYKQAKQQKIRKQIGKDIMEPYAEIFKSAEDIMRIACLLNNNGRDIELLEEDKYTLGILIEKYLIEKNLSKIDHVDSEWDYINTNLVILGCSYRKYSFKEDIYLTNIPMQQVNHVYLSDGNELIIKNIDGSFRADNLLNYAVVNTSMTSNIIIDDCNHIVRTKMNEYVFTDEYGEDEIIPVPIYMRALQISTHQNDKRNITAKDNSDNLDSYFYNALLKQVIYDFGVSPDELNSIVELLIVNKIIPQISSLPKDIDYQTFERNGKTFYTYVNAIHDISMIGATGFLTDRQLKILMKYEDVVNHALMLQMVMRQMVPALSNLEVNSNDDVRDTVNKILSIIKFKSDVNMDDLDNRLSYDEIESQRIRSRQISTDMNSERDKRYRAGEYPINSSFYNSLVLDTEDKPHISPNQLEEIYIIYDMLHQVDIELTVHLEKSLIEEGTSSDYHNQFSQVAYYKVGEEECNRVEQDKIRKQICKDIMEPYAEIFKSAEGVMKR